MEAASPTGAASRVGATLTREGTADEGMEVGRVGRGDTLLPVTAISGPGIDVAIVTIGR